MPPSFAEACRWSRGCWRRVHDPNLPDDAGFTPLNTAVERDQRDIAELLLNHRADPNLAVPGNEEHPAAGQTPLHTAAMRGNVELLRLLLDHGAFINTTEELIHR